MKTKRLFSLLLCMVLVSTLLPVASHAESVPANFIFDVSEGSVTIGAGTDSGTLKVTYGALPDVIDNIPGTQEITIIGTTTTNTVTVSSGVTVNITLSGVDINVSAASACAFDITGATVNLTLAGGTVNSLKSGRFYAGLHAPSGATLTIGGTGELIATCGGSYGAGIGGGNLESGGTVTISDGTVTANGGSGGAGIGGGNGRSGGTVTICGGTVTANGAEYAAGIGGGYGGNGGTVTISGGTVTANSAEYAAGIGGGRFGSAGTTAITGGTVTVGGSTGIQGTPTNETTETVYLTTVTLENVSAATAVSSLTTDAGYPYGISDMQTDDEGRLYLYLPENTLTTAAETGTAVFKAVSGEIETEGDGSAAGVLYWDTPPAIISVTPSGMGATVSGSLTLTFDKAMDQGVLGTVTLNGDAFASRNWSDTRTCSISYSGLDYVTAYTIGISGFQDILGHTMSSGAGHSFTTVPSADASLSSLSLVGATLSPSFASGTTAYTASVANSVSSLTVTPTASGANATITINGTAVSSGTASGDIALSVGSNTVTIVVTAQDGSTKQTYTLTVTRAQANGGGSSSSTTYYTITATADTGGSISPSGSASVAYGKDKTYTITTAKGYEIKDVLVDDVSVGAVSTYTFENVKKAHTITVSFKKTDTGADAVTVNPFTDVEENDWFYENVLYVYENGLMTGTSVNTFNSESTMTRAMLVTVLYRLSGDTGSYSGSFTDVPSGEWYENAVVWATKSGIASGVGNNRFSPDGKITREQLAVMLYNYAKYKGLDVSAGKDTKALPYNDAANISDYAYSALQWACGTGIMNGDENGSLNPQSSATRAEVAAMLQRFIENVIN